MKLALIALMLIAVACTAPGETYTYRTTLLHTTSATYCLPKGTRVRDTKDPNSNKEVRWVAVVSITDNTPDCLGFPRAYNGLTGATSVNDLDN